MNVELAVWLPWIQALGWTLLHFIWQGLAIGAAFAAVRLLIPRAHCNARYTTGLLALTAMTCWPIATFLAMRPWSVGDPGAIAAAVSSTAALSAVVDVAGPSLAVWIDAATPWLVLLWGAGVLAMSGRVMWQWRTLMSLAQRWAQSSAELDEIVLSLKKRFGILQRVRVLVSERVDTPMLVGWLRPVVLLPAAVALGFPRQQIELILAHELCHLRRHDHLVNFAQVLVETLFFYHPVVHWISREVRNERELCCDRLVLGSAVGAPRDYAHALASLEELRQTSGGLALAATGGELLERVRRIVGMPATRLAAVDAHGPGRWLLIVAVLGMTLATALRIDRNSDAVLLGTRPPVDWLQPPPALTLAVATLAFDPPRLRLAAIPTPLLKEALSNKSAPAPAVATGVRETQELRGVSAPPQVQANPVTPSTAASPAVVNDHVEATVASPIEPVSPRQSAPAPVEPAKPVALRAVTPSFPGFSRHAPARVDASFSIGADGSVRDIRISDGGADNTFAHAAERALRQWRFDPATVSSDHSTRYTQTFVFEPREAANRDSCVQLTGSHICRDVGEGMEAKVYGAQQPGGG
ncbi:MAG: TonB family protein [Dokdonella sp.]